MNELKEQELQEATTGLGNWHEAKDLPRQYLVNRPHCLQCLKELLMDLKTPSAALVEAIHLKLGEWRTLPEHLIPLFEAYREDPEIAIAVLKLFALLTTRIQAVTEKGFMQLEYLQDYKEAFAKRDIFIVLMRLLVENMDDEEEEQGENKSAPGDRRQIFPFLLTLIRNLVSVPDPRPGDAGFTPLRRNVQHTYIKHFHNEGLFDFLLLIGESVETDSDMVQAWNLLDIIYHICTQVNPEDLTSDRKAKDKTSLAALLERDRAAAKLLMPTASRHSRFGTAMMSRSDVGGLRILSTVHDTSVVDKGKGMWRKEFMDPKARSENKQNMFHDPFFVDLEEGSVRDHNKIYPLSRNGQDVPNDLGNSVIDGLRKFFDEFVQTTFSSLVTLLRSGCRAEIPGKETKQTTEYDRPKVLNFVSWILEFHRHQYAAEVARVKARRQKVKESAAEEQLPVLDVAQVQGALDQDMIQFVTARLRKYGKESNMHPSHLVIVLRALLQQLKTVSVLVESMNIENQDLGKVLFQNIVKEDVMAQLVWIMKNYKTTAHDPRILSYTVEVFHNMQRLMNTVAERESAKGGTNFEFYVERTRGLHQTRSTTSVSQELSALCDARVVENLFHLLEKYKRHSRQLHSMLVKLLYAIIRVRETNIVIFFELTYFIRIQRIVSDPVVKDKKTGKPFQEMTQLLQYILRQFFKCAEKNGCVFAELIFRKVQENPREALLENHTSEFAAILDNYENEDYRQVLDKVEAGETLNSLRAKAKAALDGTLAWSEEENQVLRDRYPVYADHPLFAELLASELPEESRRTARQVRKQLQELGLLGARFGPRESAQARAGEDPPTFHPGVDDVDDGDPPAKRQKTDGAAADSINPSGVVPGVAEAVSGVAPAGVTQQDDESLEMDLERLLDAAMDSDPFFATSAAGEPAAAAAPPDVGACAHIDAPSAQSPFPRDTFEREPAMGGPGGDDWLERELEQQLDSGDPFSQDVPVADAAAAVPAAAVGATALDTTAATASARTCAEDCDEEQSFWENMTVEGANDAAAATDFDAATALDPSSATARDIHGAPATAAATMLDPSSATANGDGVGTVGTTAADAFDSQFSQGDLSQSLELELERIMDGDF
mmetsp:Transcript_44548/g.123379  ORF Transcript_44548/g.123379 Transcript_44548/m.123379 type:complete len:1118 (+) Transcript_44548:113-3466(+)